MPRFSSYWPVQMLILSLVDNAHTAFAQFLEDPVLEVHQRQGVYELKIIDIP